MIDRRTWTGRAVHPPGTSAVEIRLVVVAVIVALLAILPAVAGAHEVGGVEINRAVAARDVEVARTVIRLMPDLPLDR